MVKFSFPRELRLVTPAQFDNVFKKPAKASSPNLTILARTNDLSHARLGIIVSKKTIKQAVGRNRFKRIIRNFFRINQHTLPAIDLVVLGKGNVASLSNEELVSLMEKLCKTVCHRCRK